MGVFLHHEPCPRCGSRDNLARYDDGSAWCFGCSKVEPRTHLPKFQEKDDEYVQLDDDLCTDFAGHVVEWLARYGISVSEALKHGWRYAPKRDQLVFIWRDEKGNVALTQARNFWKGAKVKYFTVGSVEQVLPIFQTSGLLRQLPRKLVVVEDVVSAAKIARQCDAMPCLGSTLSNGRLARLRASYDVLVPWLDEDKWKNAVNIADRAKLIGFTTKVVYTEKDPKEYEDHYITARISLP